MSPRGLIGLSAGAAWCGLSLLGACFDTRLIPADETSHGGQSAGGPAFEGGAPTGEAGAELGGSAGDTPVAGAPQGGSLGGSSQAGAAGTGELPGVTWLTLVENAAPASAGANAELAISGAFYAYADDCAVLNWDQASRCAWGSLCEAGANFENWGVAVGFDFRNTGASGEPPDTKLLWDPRQVGALGLAWQISGSAPGLQLWVLNMAPNFQGQCSEMTCEIPGPPDGASVAPLWGQLSFSNMEKDYWGGRGTNYEFDPAAVHALQFKLPAINVGAQSFAFCIEALGVIR